MRTGRFISNLEILNKVNLPNVSTCHFYDTPQHTQKLFRQIHNNVSRGTMYRTGTSQRDLQSRLQLKYV